MTLITVALAFTACGGDDTEGTRSAAREPAKVESLGTLTVAHASTSAQLAAYVAAGAGYFKDLGLEVKMLENQGGANVQPLVASGQADIGGIGISVPLLTTNSGKPTKVIGAWSGGASGGSVVAPKAASVDEVKAADNCEIITYPAGTGAYGNAQTFKKRAGLSCRVVTFAQLPAQIGALLSGRDNGVVKLGVGPALAYLSSIKEGKMKFLVDTRDAAASQQFYGDAVPEGSDYVLASTIEQRRDALVAYSRGVLRARAFIAKSTAEQIFETVKGFDSYGKVPQDIALATIENNKTFLTQGNVDGAITPEAWASMLTTLKDFDLPDFNPDDPQFAFAEAADMSIVEDAAKAEAG